MTTWSCWRRGASRSPEGRSTGSRWKRTVANWLAGVRDAAGRVLDANAVIGLAKGGVFPLLASLYAPLYIPATVRQEVIQQGQGRAGVTDLVQAIGAWIIEVVPAPQTVQQFLSPAAIADREVLAVASEKGVDHILSDDGPLRRAASGHGLTCLRVPLVVVLMKDEGLLQQVRPILDQMRQQGYGIAESIYQGALQAAGE